MLCFPSFLLPFFITELEANVCARVALLTSACVCHAYRHGPRVFLADCLQPLEPWCGDRKEEGAAA